MGLKEKCGSVGRGWNRKKKVFVRNGKFHIGSSGAIFGPKPGFEVERKYVF